MIASYTADITTALRWAEHDAEAGDYLVFLDDTGMTAEEDPDRRAGYSEDELDRIRRALAARSLALATDDRGILAADREARFARFSAGK